MMSASSVLTKNKYFCAVQSIQINQHTFHLLPQKAMWWPDKKMLVLSDVHLGKVTHFRKNGIQAPVGLIQQQLEAIENLIIQFNPERFLVLGDLFHSDLNTEWPMFIALVQKYPAIQTILIRGNHDRMPAYVLKENGIKVMLQMEESGIVFSHDLLPDCPFYVVSGHIHPSVVLTGKAKQKLRLPCFYFDSNYALLPAFGNFTGLQNVETNKQAKVFAIADNQVIALT